MEAAAKPTGHGAAPEHAPAPMGRRERNKQRVRQRLYDAAVELFAAQGYERTTVDEIAERADVSRGTFFGYFQHKENLVDLWLARREQRVAAALLDAGSSSCVEQLRHCIGTLAQVNEEEQAVLEPMLSAWVRSGRPLGRDPYLTAMFTRIFAAGVQSGEISGEVSAERAGAVLYDVYLGTLYRWCDRPADEPGTSIREELAAALELLLVGVAAR